MNKIVNTMLVALLLMVTQVTMTGYAPEMPVGEVPGIPFEKEGAFTFSGYGTPFYAGDDMMLVLYNVQNLDQNKHFLGTTKQQLIDLGQRNPQAKRLLVVWTRPGESVQFSPTQQLVDTSTGLVVYYKNQKGNIVFSFAQ